MVCLLFNHPKFNSINDKDIRGETALHWGRYLNAFKSTILFILLFKASEKGYDQVVSLLFKHPKCNLNEENEYGQTALHLGEYLNKFKLILGVKLKFWE